MIRRSRIIYLVNYLCHLLISKTVFTGFFYRLDRDHRCMISTIALSLFNLLILIENFKAFEIASTRYFGIIIKNSTHWISRWCMAIRLERSKIHEHTYFPTPFLPNGIIRLFHFVKSTTSKYHYPMTSQFHHNVMTSYEIVTWHCPHNRMTSRYQTSHFHSKQMFHFHFDSRFLRHHSLYLKWEQSIPLLLCNKLNVFGLIENLFSFMDFF